MHLRVSQNGILRRYYFTPQAIHLRGGGHCSLAYTNSVTLVFQAI